MASEGHVTVFYYEPGDQEAGRPPRLMYTLDAGPHPARGFTVRVQGVNVAPSQQGEVPSESFAFLCDGAEAALRAAQDTLDLRHARLVPVRGEG